MIQELEYHFYETRQREEISLPQLQNRAKELKSGGKFTQSEDGSWQPVGYPGFAMQAMLYPKGENQQTYAQLEKLRDRLTDGFEDTLAPLPSPSFHQTVVNTFSDKRLEENITTKGLLMAFPNLIAGAVKDYAPPTHDDPVVMNLIGISFFRTAIGVLGVFENQEHFERIIQFRKFFYNHKKLTALNIERTRPFIGHVTLVYVGKELSEDQQNKLAEHVDAINQDIKEPLPFQMKIAELCRYDDLSAYHPKYDYPSVML